MVARHFVQNDAQAMAHRLYLLRMAVGSAQGRKKPISQTEMARLCGMTVQSWHNCETAFSRIGLNSAMKIRERIGVPLDYIYVGDIRYVPHALAIEIERI